MISTAKLAELRNSFKVHGCDIFLLEKDWKDIFDTIETLLKDNAELNLALQKATSDHCMDVFIPVDEYENLLKENAELRTHNHGCLANVESYRKLQEDLAEARKMLSLGYLSKVEVDLARLQQTNADLRKQAEECGCWVGHGRGSRCAKLQAVAKAAENHQGLCQCGMDCELLKALAALKVSKSPTDENVSKEDSL